MRSFKYYTLDVFTQTRFGGNQLAVFPDAEGIDEGYLQKIANELNLSETTFVLPADDPVCDHRVRIFTPGQELPMAGHPTLGSAYVLAKQRELNTATTLSLMLEEGVGPIKVDLEISDSEPGLITMRQPLAKMSEPFGDRHSIAELLSLTEEQLVAELPIQIFDCGVPYMIIPVRDLRSVEAIKFRLDVYDRLHKSHGLPFTLAYTLETVHSQHQVHCRMFAPEAGVLEDPATGSAHGPLGSYLATYEVLGKGNISFTSEQGYEMGRPSELMVEIRKQDKEITEVLVGGYCVPVGEGSIHLP